MTYKTGIVITLVVVFLFPTALILGVCTLSSFVLWEPVIPSVVVLRFCLALGFILSLASFLILLVEEKVNDE